jgi:hypothetical protein
MSTSILLKRSDVPNLTPDISEVEIGEITINSFDGKLFTKINRSGAEAIVEIGGGSSDVSELDDLDDVDLSTNPPAVGQLLKWDGNNWVPSDKSDRRYIEDFTAPSGSSGFIISKVFESGDENIFINGILIKPSVYSITTNLNDTTLSFNSDLNEGDWVRAEVFA